MRIRPRSLGGRGQTGSLTIELIVLTPVILVFGLLALGLGRYELVREEVIGSARAAAEAASVEPSTADAQSAALAAATPAVSNRARTCMHLNVVTATNDFAPGGYVQVTVSCQVGFDDLLVPGLPGQATVQAVVKAPIDPFRTVQ
jgi:Flp pilus assembly protein TadG